MIDETRKKHSFAVAELMKEYEMNRGGKNAEELFILGLLHDVGYEFVDQNGFSLHNKIGGEALKRQGYKYWKEVYWHGIYNSPYQSEYLDILNWADMHIDHKGQKVSFEERLDGISSRYGIPMQELESKKLIDELIRKGFK